MLIINIITFDIAAEVKQNSVIMTIAERERERERERKKEREKRKRERKRKRQRERKTERERERERDRERQSERKSKRERERETTLLLTSIHHVVLTLGLLHIYITELNIVGHLLTLKQYS